MNEKEQRFYNAIDANDFDAVESLLKTENINVNNFNNPIEKNTPLVKGIILRNLHLVILLLKNGADPDLCDYLMVNPLYTALLYKDTDILATLLEFGANPNCSKGFHPLSKAIENGCDKSVRLLLKHGADAKMKDYCKHSPLWYAVCRANPPSPKIVSALVSAGANIYEKLPHARILDFVFYASLLTNLPELLYIFYYAIIVKVLIAMDALQLPTYIILWVIDKYDGMQKITEFKKVEFINNAKNSIERIRRKK